METSGQSLLDFWAWSAKKGLVPTSVANDLRAASKEVLSIEENWQNVDIKSLDVEYLMVRFDNLSKFKFKPQSLSAYKSRFKKARSLYLKYLDNPSGWHYPSSKPRRAALKPVLSNSDNMQASAPVIEVQQVAEQIDPSHQILEFPLRTGFIARLDLPADLTKDEASRLAAYLQIIVP